jgi:hypothetical protein
MARGKKKTRNVDPWTKQAQKRNKAKAAQRAERRLRSSNEVISEKKETGDEKKLDKTATAITGIISGPELDRLEAEFKAKNGIAPQICWGMNPAYRKSVKEANAKAEAASAASAAVGEAVAEAAADAVTAEAAAAAAAATG